MSYTDEEKAQFVVKFIEEGYSYAKLKTRVRRDAKNGSEPIPTDQYVKEWLKAFLETGTVHGQRGQKKLKKKVSKNLTITPL